MGFPSPDSDYDARFVYVRTAAQHLTPWPVRDVIELPLSGELDVNGWDLAKALALLLKGNAVVIEWLKSPLVYAVDPRFRAEMLAFADRFARRDAVARHYLHLGQRTEREFVAGRDEVKLKKLFYALRPAAALRWLRVHPDRAVAPMALPVLMAESDPPPEVAEAVAVLIAQKAVTREMGSAPAPAVLVNFIRRSSRPPRGGRRLSLHLHLPKLAWGLRRYIGRRWSGWTRPRRRVEQACPPRPAHPHTGSHGHARDPAPARPLR